jgi:hypothetical protein
MARLDPVNFDLFLGSRFATKLYVSGLNSRGVLGTH